MLSALASVCVAAPDYTDTAQVISSTPIIERVTDQRQECVPDNAGAPAPARERSLVGPVVGGVAGGVLGSQVGRGSGRTAATAAGAIAGTIIGDRVGNADSDRVATAPPMQRCRIVEPARLVRGRSCTATTVAIPTSMPYNRVPRSCRGRRKRRRRPVAARAVWVQLPAEVRHHPAPPLLRRRSYSIATRR